MVLGWGIWYFFLKSGVHPSIAGMLVAFTIPLYRKLQVADFKNKMDQNLLEFCSSEDHTDEVTLTDSQLAAIDNMENEIERVHSPIQKLEHKLHGFVTYIVMPLFALANAGVVIKSSHVSDLFNPLSMNIQISLIAGKLLGIFIFTWLAIQLGISDRPRRVKWIHLFGIALLGGIGFTMSLFIANLAFPGPPLLEQSKIGILLGSLMAGILGFIILRLTLKAKKK
jgi:NhaA family Na+:H+ antiporter